MPNWERFHYITVGRILEELAQDGLKINRHTFMKLEQEGLFLMGRTVGKHRRCTREEAEIIKHLVKENFAFDNQYDNSKRT